MMLILILWSNIIKHVYKNGMFSPQKNYVTQEVPFYNRQIDFGHL